HHPRDLAPHGGRAERDPLELNRLGGPGLGGRGLRRDAPAGPGQRARVPALLRRPFRRDRGGLPARVYRLQEPLRVTDAGWSLAAQGASAMTLTLGRTLLQGIRP